MGQDGEAEQVASLIDQFVAIGDVNINSLNFDREDKKEFQELARDQAFNNAQTKAEDYASIANLSVGQALKIQDGTFTETVAEGLN